MTPLKPPATEACIAIMGACIKLALQDAMGDDPLHRASALYWLHRTGYDQLLQHPGAESLTPTRAPHTKRKEQRYAPTE